ncbi:MAG TPA: iron ABC transporter permease [Spirochaetota bacterium]|nr:iron ABC transporter permease [Spirochaetota bacterium]HOL56713.1 iron ABC transporter permease [Spirochaetota bacterium]HPP04132.1 iron ABC transporter permease [Spirochaetota bacterium]
MSIKIKIQYLILLSLFILLLFLSLISIAIGSKSIPIDKILIEIKNYFIYPNAESIEQKIIINLRIPRIILAIFVGGMLSVCGLILQTIFKNPLVEPFTLGISASASFGVALAIFISDFFLKIRIPFFPFSLISGILGVSIILLFSLSKNISIYTIIFIGISISYFFNALLTLLLSLLGNRSYDIIIWMFGSFSIIPSRLVIILFIFFSLIILIVLLLFHKELDLFYFSEDVIKSMGVKLNILRTILLGLISFITIFSVSFCGIIGFVGLVIPNIAKLIFYRKHNILIMASFLMGGILLLISDDIARSLVSLFSDYGKELPIGVITSIIGVPFFIYFLTKREKI